MLFFFECVQHRKALITGSYLKYHWLISNIKYISEGLFEEEKIIWKSGRNRGESFCVWRVLWRYRVTNFPYITQRFFVLNHGLWIEDTVVCFWILSSLFSKEINWIASKFHLVGRIHMVNWLFLIYKANEIWNFSSSVQLDSSRVSAMNKWDVELNTRRTTQYLQATMYYFVYHITTIALYWQEKPT